MVVTPTTTTDDASPSFPPSSSSPSSPSSSQVAAAQVHGLIEIRAQLENVIAFLEGRDPVPIKSIDSIESIASERTSSDDDDECSFKLLQHCHTTTTTTNNNNSNNNIIMHEPSSPITSTSPFHFSEPEVMTGKSTTILNVLSVPSSSCSPVLLLNLGPTPARPTRTQDASENFTLEQPIADGGQQPISSSSLHMIVGTSDDAATATTANEDKSVTTNGFAVCVPPRPASSAHGCDERIPIKNPNPTMQSPTRDTNNNNIIKTSIMNESSPCIRTLDTKSDQYSVVDVDGPRGRAPSPKSPLQVFTLDVSDVNQMNKDTSALRTPAIDSPEGEEDEEQEEQGTCVGRTNDINSGADSNALHAAANLARLQVLQARRQVESGVKEISRLQGRVRHLESQLLNNAAPRAVMKQAGELQRRITELELELSRMEASGDSNTTATAPSVLVTVQDDVGDDKKQLVQRISALEKQNAKLKEAAEAAHRVATQAVARAAAAASASSAQQQQQQTQQQQQQPQPQQHSDQKSEVRIKWEEEKRLQKKIDLLKAKLDTQTKATNEATAAKEKLQKQYKRIKNELGQVKAENTPLKSKMNPSSSSSPHPSSSSSTSTIIQQISKELEDLQKKYDDLQRKTVLSSKAAVIGGASSRSAPTTPLSSVSLPLDASTIPINTNANKNNSVRIVELELERDQAVARANRLQHRLDQFLSLPTTWNIAAVSTNTTTIERNSKAVHPRQHTNNNVSHGKGHKSLTQRERELLDTIQLLRSALEKTRKGLENGVSNAKYMSAVEKAKQASVRVKELESQVGGMEELRAKAKSAQQEAANAQVMVSALRGQLKEVKRRGKERLSARDQIMNAQVAELERALKERDAKVAALQHSACDEARELLAEGLTPGMLVNELLVARKQLARLQQQQEEEY